LRYSFADWIAFFYLYCFFGWIIESTIVSITERKFVNRGFLRLPLLPLYGLGAITILFSTLPFQDNPTLVYLSGAISCTILEFLTGTVMEGIFKVKYWDYSHFEFNFQGKISLLSSMFWGFLSLLLVFQIHYLADKIIMVINDTAVLTGIILISLVFLADMVYSVKTALDVKNILVRMTQIKNEVESLVLQTIINSEKAHVLKERIAKLSHERQLIIDKLSFYKKALLRANPRAKSEKFNDALKDLKRSIKMRITGK